MSSTPSSTPQNSFNKIVSTIQKNSKVRAQKIGLNKPRKLQQPKQRMPMSVPSNLPPVSGLPPMPIK